MALTKAAKIVLVVVVLVIVIVAVIVPLILTGEMHEEPGEVPANKSDDKGAFSTRLEVKSGKKICYSKVDHIFHTILKIMRKLKDSVVLN